MNTRKKYGSSELDWIRRFAERSPAPPGTGIVAGIGDDCAIFREPSGRDLLFTTDLLIEGVHFRRETHRPADVGWKALARGLSDIAAMGGEPRFCLLSLALPIWADRRWVDRFYDGLLQLSAREKAPLIGGDLAHSDKLICDIVVAGAVPRGAALRRDGAKAGDTIYVSGNLGASAFGLRVGKGPGWKRHLRPEPRIALGRQLRARWHATSAMDLSDGLSIDLHRLATASNLSAEIGLPPVFRGATLEDALHGGEDYELLFTLPPARPAPRQFGAIPITRIGTMRKGPPGVILLEGVPLAPLGYDHFRAP